jgi:hypothetical protein
MELRVVKSFPGVPILLEKPLAVVQNDADMQDVFVVSEKMEQARIVCSVAFVSFLFANFITNLCYRLV